MSAVQPIARRRPADHRTRIAAEKRDRMRTRLIEAALRVFAAQSVDATVIDDVIRAAGVSRGTFYNYFRTSEELMAAVLLAVGDEVLELVGKAIAGRRDPAERLVSGLRLMLHTARRFPVLGRFVSRVSIDRGLQHSLRVNNMVRDLEEAAAAGRIHVSQTSVGVDLVMGTMREALYAIGCRHDLPASYPEDLTLHLLLGLGMTRASARRLVDIPLAPVVLPPDSLLSRAQASRLRTVKEQQRK